MRNLKKFLALVLAMMMTLSLMVTVNAATTYPDQDKAEPKFNEAIDVLSGVGVIKGDDKGNFNPTDNITRAEAAAIMYRIVTGDVDDERDGLHTGVVNFTDVKDGDWFAGYVGFCADRGIIKGDGDGMFRPHANVTGYEMLAMLLRAVGYGQKNEFTGSGWQIPVGSRATALGILDNVNTTIYGGNLRGAARRDVVADLTFQTITKAHQVTMSSLGDYNEYTSLVSNIKNPTLGEKVFKLACMTGIIVGNQATGEDYTQLGTMVNVAGDNVGASYIYATDNTTTMTGAATANATIAFDTDTGLDKFGHKVDIWYKHDTNDKAASFDVGTGTTISVPSGYGTIYCVRDLSSKTAVVYAADAKIAATTDELYKAAAGEDFAVDRTNGTWTSDAFQAMDATNNKGKTTMVNAKGTSNIYLLISNSAANSKDKYPLDLVVSLKVTVQQVSAVNAFSDPNTVSVRLRTDATTWDTATEIGVGKVEAKKMLAYGEDDGKVGNIVVVNEVFGTSNDLGGTTMAVGTDPYFGLNALTEKKTGTITAISGDGEITLDTGDKIKVSPLFNLVGFTANAVKGVQVDGTTALSDAKGWNDLPIGARRTFLLDKDGKYVGAETPKDTILLGTYAYWVQDGIDTVKHYIKGVTLDGQITDVEINTASYDAIITANDINYLMAKATTNNVLTVKDNNGKYMWYEVDGAGKATKLTPPTKGITAIPGNTSLSPKSTEIAAGKFLQNDTVFYAITGWGSTLKVEALTGLTAALKGAASIDAKGWYMDGNADTEHVDPNNNIVSKVFLDSTSVWMQPNNFIYGGVDALNAGATTVDTLAKQWQLYFAGNDTSSGVLVLVADTPAVKQFYTYTVNEKGYYDLDLVADDDRNNATPAPSYAIYGSAAVTKEGTAFGYIKTTSAKHTGGITIYAQDATVIDLTDNGIDSYAKLRQASEENSVIVDVLLTEKGGTTASIIYVNDFS